MKIHTAFTFYHFLELSGLLLILNFIILNFRKESFKKIWNWKFFAAAVLVTFLGLFYWEVRQSGDFTIKSFGFPRGFYELQKSYGSFTEWNIFVFNKFYFLQNLIIFT